LGSEANHDPMKKLARVLVIQPPVTGNQTLTATLTPTDGTFSAATSNPTSVYVVKRGNTR